MLLTWRHLRSPPLNSSAGSDGYKGQGEAYAVAQGTVQTGAVSAGGASGSSITKGVPTAGRIAGGAIVERELGFQLASMPQMRMTLRNPDFTTARRVAEAVNGVYPGSAVVENPTIVTLRPPVGVNMVAMISRIENPFSYTHLLAPETKANLVCRLLFETKNVINFIKKLSSTYCILL